MRIFNIYCLLFISLRIFAQQIPEIKIDPFKFVTGDLRLSDLVETIEYVPLETTNKCLIGVAPKTFDISENYIVIHCWKTNQVYLFKRNGSFVSLIGSEGTGPGEYLKMAITNIFIDEGKKQILIGTAYPNQLSVYNLNGKFLKKYSINNTDGVAFFSRYFNNQFLLNYPNSGDFPYLYEWRTIEMKPITKAVKSIPFSIKNTFVGFAPSFNYLYEGNLYVGQNVMNDTLYMINNNKKFIPKYRINVGKYEVTPELRSDGDELWKKLPDLVGRVNAFESTKHLFIDCFFRTKGESKRRDYFAYYSKDNRTLRYFDSPKGIPNDYDGGIAFWPTIQNEHIGYAFYNASDLCENEPEQQRLAPKGPEKAVQAFKRMCKKMLPDDNPVLIIVKLKK